LHRPGVRPGLHHLPSKLTAVVHGDRRGLATLPNCHIQGLCHVAPVQPGLSTDGYALPRELVDHRQNSELLPVFQSGCYEVHAPPLIGGLGMFHNERAPSRDLLPQLGPNHQTLLFVDPVGAFRVHHPALTSQQYRQAPGAKTNTRRRQLLQAHSQGKLGIPPMLVAQAWPANAHQTSGLPFAVVKTLTDPGHQRTPHCVLQTFFESTSCRMCLSRLRSATGRFNRLFSSRSCLSFRNSETPSPP